MGTKIAQPPKNVTSANTDATQYLIDSDKDNQRNGVVLRNTSLSGDLLALVGSAYTSSGQLTSATGHRIRPGDEWIVNAEPSENVWVKPSAIGQTFVLEQYRGDPPSQSINSNVSSIFDAGAFGFSPSNTASGNSAALIAANAVLSAQGGGILAVYVPGTYVVDQCLLFAANVYYWAVSPGIEIKQSNAIQDFVGRNASGFNGDANITIDGFIFNQAASEGTLIWNSTVYTVGTGTVTSATATTITIPTDISTNPSHYEIFILTGTGQTQSRRIASRTGAGQYTLSGNGWAITPDATSTYRICRVKTRVTKTTTASGVGFTTQGTTNSDFSNGLATGTNVWSGPLLFLNCPNLTFKNCTIRDCAGNSIKLAGCYDYLIENITLDSVTYCANINQDGIHIEGGSASPFSTPSLGSERVGPIRGSRNGIIRNIRTNPTFGRGVTDNTLALVTCDYLSQNWLGGEIDTVAISNVYNPMAMETHCRNLGQRQHQGQDCGLRNITYRCIRGKQSWLPKFGLPTASGDGYCQITGVTSQTVFTINANGASQFPGGIIAVNDYVYVTGIEKWVIVTGVSGTTITVAGHPDAYAVGQYVAKVAKTVQAIDIISDGGDSQSNVPDHGTNFTTVGSGGGAAVATVTLAATTINGRTLQVGDWIYNATRSGGLVQLTSVNTGTGVIAWSGNQNYQNGDTVNLCLTYGLLPQSKVNGFTVEDVQFDTTITMVTINPGGGSSAYAAYADVSGYSLRGLLNKWQMRAGSMIDIGGTCTDISLAKLKNDHALSTRETITLSSGASVKMLRADDCYHVHGLSAGGGFIGTSNSSAYIPKCDKIFLSNINFSAPALEWFIDMGITATDGSSACRIYIDNCDIVAYGLWNTRRVGVNVDISISGNSRLSCSDRVFDSSVSLSGSDIITVRYGAGIVLGGTVGQSRWTSNGANFASATVSLYWGQPNGTFSASGALDLHSDSSRVAGVYFYTGTGGHTWNFPTVAKLKDARITFKNIGSGAAITLAKASVDGSVIYESAAAASALLAPGESKTFVCNGTYWSAI